MVPIEAESEFTASSLQFTACIYNNSFDSSYCYLACLSLFLREVMFLIVLMERVTSGLARVWHRVTIWAYFEGNTTYLWLGFKDVGRCSTYHTLKLKLYASS